VISCRAPWNRVWIGIDGNVSFCCYQRVIGPDLVLGNIYVDRLEDILNGPIAMAIREQMMSVDLPEVCRGCPWYEAEKQRLESAEDSNGNH
jgi:radical SAM protein with 4Fe4S-binding SPASM domain